MIGLNVYNPNNEKIGDISEILMDKNGNAEVVVIGVGDFSVLAPKTSPYPLSPCNGKWTGRGSHQTACPLRRPTEAPRCSLQAPRCSLQAPPAEPSSRAQGYPDHVVLNMTQDQLKTAPDFKYVGSASEPTQPPSTPAPKE